MTNAEQIDFARKLFEECLTVLESKGKAYSGSDDAHANFKQTAGKIGNTEYQVWATYFGKHVDCIMRAIKANPSAPVDDTEGLRGRILDAVNYLAILGGMIDRGPSLQDMARKYEDFSKSCIQCESGKCALCDHYSNFERAKV